MIRRLLVLLGGEGFGSDVISTRRAVQHFAIQKILRLNSNAPWPVHWTSKIISPAEIQRGTRLPGLSQGCHIDGRNGIIFGSNVWVGPRVSIISMNHDLNDYSRYTREAPIVIGDNCWLATNSVVLPGVVLGEHTIVAAGAVVTKPFPDGNQVLAGSPARVIRELPPYGVASGQELEQ